MLLQKNRYIFGETLMGLVKRGLKRTVTQDLLAMRVKPCELGCL